MNVFDRFRTIVGTKYDIQIKYKDQSWFMKILSYILFFNKGFMTNYITTIGSTIYFPNESACNDLNSAGILAHELVHVKDRAKLPYLFELIYLFPQILSIFSLLSILAVISMWWLLCLAFLLFLLPLPAYGRLVYESRAYAMSLYFLQLTDSGKDIEPDLLYYAKLLTGSGYYFASWNSDFVQLMLRNNCRELPLSDTLFQEVKRWADFEKGLNNFK